MLVVLHSGNKVWRLAYSNEAGKQKTVMIGPYPSNGLKKARERRDALRLKLVDGDELMPHASCRPRSRWTRRSSSIGLPAPIDYDGFFRSSKNNRIERKTGNEMRCLCTYIQTVAARETTFRAWCKKYKYSCNINNY